MGNGQSGQVPTVRVAVEMTAHSHRSQRARTPKKKDNHTYCFLASTLLTGEREGERECTKLCFVKNRMLGSAIKVPRKIYSSPTTDIYTHLKIATTFFFLFHFVKCEWDRFVDLKQCWSCRAKLGILLSGFFCLSLFGSEALSHELVKWTYSLCKFVYFVSGNGEVDGKSEQGVLGYVPDVGGASFEVEVHLC